MSEPPPSVVLLAKLSLETSRTAGARSTGRLNQGERMNRGAPATNSVPSSLRSSATIWLPSGSLT